MAKMGRKNVYDTHIKPFFPNILEMCQNMTDKQIAEALGVSYTAFKKHKKEQKELSDLLQKGRQNLVVDLKSTLIKKAKGFFYDEVEETKELNPDTGELETVKKVFKKKYAQPDTGAAHLLLKNYDKENWSNDPQILELRKKELELREKQIENNAW